MLVYTSARLQHVGQLGALHHRAAPLAHILIDYQNLPNAQILRSYAHALNTSAHIVSTFWPTTTQGRTPTSSGWTSKTRSTPSPSRQQQVRAGHAHQAPDGVPQHVLPPQV